MPQTPRFDKLHRHPLWGALQGRWEDLLVLMVGTDWRDKALGRFQWKAMEASLLQELDKRLKPPLRALRPMPVMHRYRGADECSWAVQDLIADGGCRSSSRNQ